MIQFNELRITPKDKTLIIDVSIKDDLNYENVYLNQIRIDNQDTHSNFGPSSNPLYDYVIDSSKNLKVLRLNIKSEDLQILGNLLFINVDTRGLPNVQDDSNMTALIAIADLEPIYKSIIKLISNQGEHCKDNSKLVDYILKIHSLDLALKTCNYHLAIKYWKKFFTRLKLESLTEKCNQK